MNPDKNNPVDLEDEIDAIRIQIYEKTKDMTSQERANYFNRRAREIIKEHGLTNVKFVSTPPETDSPKNP